MPGVHCEAVGGRKVRTIEVDATVTQDRKLIVEVPPTLRLANIALS